MTTITMSLVLVLVMQNFFYSFKVQLVLIRSTYRRLIIISVLPSLLLSSSYMNYHLIRFFISTVSLKYRQMCIYIPVSSQPQQRRQHSILSVFWYFNLLICSRYYLIYYVEILISFYSYLLLYFVNLL